MPYDYNSTKHKESSKKAVARFRQNKIERFREISRIAASKFRKKHPDLVRYNVALRAAKRRGAPGSFTLNDWELLKKKYNNTCPCCKNKESVSNKLTIDHIVPLSKGGTNYITNIQPLCKRCNSIKHTQIIKYEYN